MSPKGIVHERLKVWLNLHLVRNLPDGIEVAQATTLYLSDDTFLEPDFVLYNASDGLENLNGNTVKLAIEVAASSLRYDLGRKADVYAEFGVRELWVIDAETLETRIHGDPIGGKYETILDAPVDQLLSSSLISGLTVCLKDFA